MPQVDQVRHKSSKLPVIVAAICGVVVVAVIVAVIVVMQLKPKSAVKDTKTVEKEALALSFRKEYDAALSALNSQLQYAKNDEEKLDIYLAIGQTNMQKKDYKAAVAAYQEAAKLKPGFGTNETIAKAADAGGDKALALDYYRRNLELIKNGQAGPRHGEKERIEEAIKRLEAMK